MKFLDKILKKGNYAMPENYFIITAGDYRILMDNVNHFLSKNPSYKPKGGVCVSKGYFYQALYNDVSTEAASPTNHIISD